MQGDGACCRRRRRRLGEVAARLRAGAGRRRARRRSPAAASRGGSHARARGGRRSRGRARRSSTDTRPELERVRATPVGRDRQRGREVGRKRAAVETADALESDEAVTEHARSDHGGGRSERRVERAERTRRTIAGVPPRWPGARPRALSHTRPPSGGEALRPVADRDRFDDAVGPGSIRTTARRSCRRPRGSRRSPAPPTGRARRGSVTTTASRSDRCARRYRRGVRRPDGAVADCDRRRPVPDGDVLEFAGAGVEPRDRRGGLVGDPERTEAVGEVARGRAGVERGARTGRYSSRSRSRCRRGGSSTHTRPGLTATPLGPSRPVMRLTSPVQSRGRSDEASHALHATHSDPCPNANAVRSRSTGIVCRDEPVAGSTRETVLSKTFTTQSDPTPLASRPGPDPTRPGRTSRLLPGSIAPAELASIRASPSPK